MKTGIDFKKETGNWNVLSRQQFVVLLQLNSKSKKKRFKTKILRKASFCKCSIIKKN